MTAPNSPATTKNPMARTAAFLVVVGAVLGTFILLGQQGTPPRMPATDPHRLRFNHNGDLIGVLGEPGLQDAEAAAVVLEKKIVEKRVNTTCQSCHGEPAVDLSTHPCHTIGKCIPKQHPPKTECIKCHRMPKLLPSTP